MWLFMRTPKCANGFSPQFRPEVWGGTSPLNPLPLGDGASLRELAKLSPVGPAKLHCRML